LIGLSAFAVVMLLVAGPAGILIAATGAVVFADAWIAGVFKKRGESAFLNISPMGWGIFTIGLFVVGYPLYAYNRNRLKTRPGKGVLFVAVNVLGALTCLLVVIPLIVRAMHR
jgi:hypothetical protein